MLHRRRLRTDKQTSTEGLVSHRNSGGGGARSRHRCRTMRSGEHGSLPKGGGGGGTALAAASSSRAARPGGGCAGPTGTAKANQNFKPKLLRRSWKRAHRCRSRFNVRKRWCNTPPAAPHARMAARRHARQLSEDKKNITKLAARRAQVAAGRVPHLDASRKGRDYAGDSEDEEEKHLMRRPPGQPRPHRAAVEEGPRPTSNTILAPRPTESMPQLPREFAPVGPAGPYTTTGPIDMYRRSFTCRQRTATLHAATPQTAPRHSASSVQRGRPRGRIAVACERR